MKIVPGTANVACFANWKVASRLTLQFRLETAARDNGEMRFDAMNLPPLRDLPDPFNAAVFHFPCHGQPSLWNSSASPAEISCSSAVMRATISSTASGA